MSHSSDSSGRLITTCRSCQGRDLYVQAMEAGAILPELGSLWKTPMIDVVVCATCGHLSMFLDEDSAAEVRTSEAWTPINTPMARAVPCRHCGYDMRGAPGTCPECGKPPVG